MRHDARLEIGQRLLNDVQRARIAYDGAAKTFNALIGEVPSGLPHPDGALRLKQAGKESRRTLDLYSQSLKRYSEFILRNVIPEDLEP